MEAAFGLLPENRVRDASTLVMGIDYAGFLFLNGGRKPHICLFTYAIYRAD